MANTMERMASNAMIFGAGKEGGEITGYAVGTDGKPIDMYNGMVAVKKQRSKSVYSTDTYTTYDDNCWEMVAPDTDDNANEQLYILMADEPTMAVVAGNLFRNLGRKVFGMMIPKEYAMKDGGVRWYKINADDCFRLSEGSFVAPIGTEEFATVTVGDFKLTAVSAEPAVLGAYFVISENTSNANVGGSDGGRMFMLDMKFKLV